MSKKQKVNLKKFVIKKYIMASCAQDALKKERSIQADDCWIDEEWRRKNDNEENVVGFRKS